MSIEKEANNKDAAATKQLRNLLYGRAMKSIYLPRPAPEQFAKGERLSKLYPFVANAIGPDTPLTYLEFGVFRGTSLSRMAELFTSPDATFIGFDSFEGLPESWADMEAGTFSTNGKPPKIDDKRVSFVTGYFQNSFRDFIAGFEYKSPVLVHFDADLYSSTLFLLASLWHHLPEYYFIFDEFPIDEVIAMHDFVSAFPVEYEFLACTIRENALLPSQLFGRIKSIPLKP